jgi:hypothetical protein
LPNRTAIIEDGATGNKVFRIIGREIGPVRVKQFVTPVIGSGGTKTPYIPIDLVFAAREFSLGPVQRLVPALNMNVAIDPIAIVRLIINKVAYLVQGCSALLI